MTAAIAGIGTALPGDAMRQHDLWRGFFGRHFAGSRGAERIFTSAGVRSRHAVANPLVEDVSAWSTGRRMRRYTAEAHPLGHRAVSAALAAAGLAAETVKLLVVTTCTGYATPGLDVQLARSLGLPDDAQRLLVGHMGCYAALPSLGSAADFVVAHGRPAVLLCLELTSLHVQPPTGELDQVVSHALFGDAAVAVVLTPAAPAAPVPSAPSVPSTSSVPSVASVASAGHGRLRVRDLVARTDLTASDHMTWHVTDLGFRMGLSRAVPAVLARHVRPAVEQLLSGHRLTIADVGAWAVHPGGPAILDTVQRQLDLPPAALDASRSVLARRGNCSSPTVLLVLDELLAAGAGAEGRPVVALAFGPGLTLYAALLGT